MKNTLERIRRELKEDTEVINQRTTEEVCVLKASMNDYTLLDGRLGVGASSLNFGWRMCSGLQFFCVVSVVFLLGIASGCSELFAGGVS
jgi:hypothetical protein